jgi:hypothetical protein
MPSSTSKRLTLLSAYEELTRKEGLCVREENFDPLPSLQGKKAVLLESLSALSREGIDDAERQEFNQRLAELKRQEDENAALLGRKMEANREECRKLGQNASSASKLRKAYASQARGEEDSDSLKGRA